jgi:hypothetical protein
VCARVTALAGSNAPALISRQSSSDVANQACSDYRVNLAAANFGECLCGFPKAMHKMNQEPGRPRGPSAAAERARTASSAARNGAAAAAAATPSPRTPTQIEAAKDVASSSPTTAAAATQVPADRWETSESWYYSAHGQQRGPVGFTELGPLLAKGKGADGIGPDTLMWCERMGAEWKKLRELPLYALVQQPAASPTLTKRVSHAGQREYLLTARMKGHNAPALLRQHSSFAGEDEMAEGASVGGSSSSDSEDDAAVDEDTLAIMARRRTESKPQPYDPTPGRTRQESKGALHQRNSIVLDAAGRAVRYRTETF